MENQNQQRTQQIKTEGTNISREKITIINHNGIYPISTDNNPKYTDKKPDSLIKSNQDHNIILQANQDKYFTLLNRLIHSKKCILFYICLLILSLGIIIYTIVNIIYPKLSI